jgi:hypothetical protein
VAVAGSLAADAALVWLGTRVFPSTRGYVHFRFSDYATLTVVGVLGACAGWPVVTRVTSSPRWLFLRLAVIVTLVLWLPDVALLVKHEPARAVGVLMLMHLAIAVVTYNALVRIARIAPIAPAQVAAPDRGGAPTHAGPAGGGATPRVETPLGPGRGVWLTMLGAVTVEFGLGLAALVVVPLGRPSRWLPARGEAVYGAHALLGGVLGVSAVVLLFSVGKAGRLTRIGGWFGLIGLALGAAGGVLAVYHPLRIAGIGLMFLAPAMAFFGYLMPLIEASRAARTPG